MRLAFASKVYEGNAVDKSGLFDDNDDDHNGTDGDDDR